VGAGEVAPQLVVVGREVAVAQLLLGLGQHRGAHGGARPGGGELA
jgi:hypothetical protein